MTISRAVLAAALAFAGAAVPTAGAAQEAPPPPAPATPPAQPQQPAQPERVYDITPAERAALTPAIAAVDARDWAAAQAALPAAQAAAASADAKYIVAQIQLKIGIETANEQLQAVAVDGLIASGGAEPHEMPALLENQARFAAAAGDTAKAERALSQLAALTPDDPAEIVRSALARINANDHARALELYQRAIEVAQRAGQPVPEQWRRQSLALAYQNRMGPRALALAQELVEAHPNPANWRSALLIYREFSNPDDALALDLNRLMRATQSLTGAGDYLLYANALSRGGLPGEVEAVLEEGMARGIVPAGNGDAVRMLSAARARTAEDRAGLAGQRSRAMAASAGREARATGDAYFGYGQYAEAAALYRAALQKGGEDSNLVNTRLGAALALAGQRAEAEAAFRAVTGPRQALAGYWLLWLSRRGG